MTIDFRLNWEDKILNDSMVGYYIPMNPVTNNEVPFITSEPAELLGQTQALLATINQGQLIDYPTYGIDTLAKQRMSDNNILAEIYTNTVLANLSEMILEVLINNPDIRNYASTEYIETTIEPQPFTH